MTTNFPPGATAQQPRHLHEHMFTTLAQGADRFRILTLEYNQTMAGIRNMSVFWLMVSLVQMGALLEYGLDGQQGLLVLGCAFVGLSMAAGAAGYHWRKLARMLIFSLVNLSVLFCSLTLMAATHTPKMIIPASIYSKSNDIQLSWKP